MTVPDVSAQAEDEIAGRMATGFPGGPDVDPAAAEIEELRHAVRMRDELIAVAAHELRNPMTPILMQVQRLIVLGRRDPTTPQPILTGLSRLEVAVDAYVRRATTLLELSQLNASRLELEPAATDLTALARDTVESHRPLATAGGSRLTAEIQDGVHGMLDRVAVERVLENLLSNAVKYGAGEPVELVLRSDGATACVTVRDHGPGIPEEDQRRIFERFERAVGQRRHGGFGIGLWVVRQLVEAMGGTLGVESRVGFGSTFTVTIPLTPPPREEPTP